MIICDSGYDSETNIVYIHENENTLINNAKYNSQIHKQTNKKS